MTKITLRNDKILLTDVIWETTHGCLIDHKSKMVAIPIHKIKRIDKIEKNSFCLFQHPNDYHCDAAEAEKNLENLFKGS